MSSLPFQKMSSEVLVVDPRTREVHLLNDTATRIWELLDAPHTPDELIATLSDEFEVPGGTLRPDVETVLQELASKGLIGPDPAGRSGIER